MNQGSGVKELARHFMTQEPLRILAVALINIGSRSLLEAPAVKPLAGDF
jgi:hypothetical protein